MFPRGITFDDVLLVPGYNGIRSRQAVTTEVELPRADRPIRSRSRSSAPTWTPSPVVTWRSPWPSSVAWASCTAS